nr:unnamed protein product [Spirometra erinaceieuropaei]
MKTTVKRLTEEVADLNRKHREPAGEVLENGNCADDEEHVENGHCAAAPSQPINGGDFQ